MARIIQLVSVPLCTVYTVADRTQEHIEVMKRTKLSVVIAHMPVTRHGYTRALTLIATRDLSLAGRLRTSAAWNGQ